MTSPLLGKPAAGVGVDTRRRARGELGGALGIGLLVVLGAAGCEIRRSPGRPLLTSSPDPAVSLATRLPRGADTCVVARAGAVGREHAELLSPLSRAHLGLAWQLPISAYAEVARRMPRRRRRREIWLSTSDPSRLREHLLGRAPVGIRLESECDAGRTWCLDDRGRGVFRLHRGPWGPSFPVEGYGEEVPSDVSLACGRRLAASPSLLEVAIGEESSPTPDDFDAQAQLAAVPGQRAQLLYRDARGVRLLHTIGPVNAAAELRVPFEAFERLHGARANALRRSFDGRTLRLVATYLWEDLAFQARDREFAREAAAAEAAESDLVPPAQVDVANGALLTNQLRLRRGALGELLEADPIDEDAVRAQALPLVALLLRAFGAHPEETHALRQAVELVLWPLRDGERARQLLVENLAAEELALGPFAEHRRRAAALAGTDDELVGLLAEADLEVRVAELALFRRAARVGGRFDYAIAEDGWRRFAQMRRHGALARPLRRSVRVPRAGLAELMLALAELDPQPGFEPPVHALVWSMSATPEGDEPIFIRPGGVTVQGASVCVGLSLGAAGRAKVGEGRRPSPDGLFEWSRCMAPRRDGDFLAVLVLGAGELAQSPVVLRGTVRGEEVEVRAASAARELDWERVARWLAAPLTMWGAGGFQSEAPIEVFEPGPELPGILEALRDAEFSCSAEGPLLRCFSSADRASAREAWIEALGSSLRRR